MVTRELQEKVEISFGQPGYSVHQINRMLGELSIARFDTATLRAQARRSGLIVDITKEEVRTIRDPRYLILESNLGTLMGILVFL